MTALRITILGVWAAAQALATAYTWTQTTAKIDSGNWTPKGFLNAIDDLINLNNALGGAVNAGIVAVVVGDDEFGQPSDIVSATWGA